MIKKIIQTLETQQFAIALVPLDLDEKTSDIN
jgi:hypothetical protein